MKNLTNLKVINEDVEFGFFFVEFDNGESLQCCTSVVTDDLGIMKAHISKSDNGFMDGLCGDCNEWAAINGDWTHINDFLIGIAEERGIEIID